ncbi:glycosyl hydrolase family 8 [Falsiroseomonas sp.]|uniref:glycosyl hydrolase family 8 n=1 Tax=Falsiroseomonas sp. TaxID=2870721 RepID=UPI003F6F6298
MTFALAPAIRDAAPSAVVPAALVTAAPTDPSRADWEAFKRRYLAGDGRVVDTGNAGISHSEGQSYGMLLATWMDDRPAFEAMWRWSNRRLRRSGDSLLAWRYDPHARRGVIDQNNATDGDLIFAWALHRGALRWDSAEMMAAASAVAQDLLTLCVTTYVDRQVLLPGTAGFLEADRVVLNPSYYAFNAFRSLSRLLPDNRWLLLETGGIDILGGSRFGRWGLPPDWSEVRANGDIRPAPAWPARFSWDAIRVPLHVAWAGLDLPVLQAAVTFWTAPGMAHSPPAWVDLRSGAMPPYAGHAGIRAVINLAAWRSGRAGPPPRIPVTAASDYYGASLILLAAMAASEGPEAPALPGAVTAPPGDGMLTRVRNFLGLDEAEEAEPMRSPPRRLR